MHSRLLTLATAVSGASAVFNGFNYGNKFTDGRIKVEADFEAEFKTAQALEGTDGRFNSARLYTMIQAGTDNQPIAAVPAAIKTKTSLLFGLWASAGQEAFNKELAALKNTIDQYCSQLDGLVAGISIGSEDLYRISPTGQKNSPDPGAGPDVLLKYIKSVRDTIKGSCLQNAPIGHVDTWNAYSNDTNLPVIEALDWVGIDTYPYFENEKDNDISNGAELFDAAVDKVKKVAGGKPIFITETGWPVSGPTENKAVPGTKEAQKYWQTVGCPMFANTNVWWYTLQDGAPTMPSPAFGVVGSTLSTKPLYDLSCKGHETRPSHAASHAASGASADVKLPGSASPSDANVSGSHPAVSTKTGANATFVPTAATTTAGATAGATTLTPSSGSFTTGLDGGSAPDASKSTPTSGSDTKTAPSTLPSGAGSRLNALAGVAAGALLVAAAL
ncbi:hypothetical protein E4U41_003488 [Claviceps citrina]|nr:hypothetical protein E4U41_003488 [Claviceps citrina]